MKTSQRILCLGLPVLLAGALWAVEPGVDRPPPPPAPAGPPPTAAGEAGAMGRGGAGRRGPVMDMLEQYRDKLKKEDPAEFERLMKLKDTDPEAFRKEIRERVMRDGGMREMARENFANREGMPGGREGGMRDMMRPRPMPEDEKCLDLARQYHDARTPAEKEKLKTDLQAAINLAFEKRLVTQRERVEKMDQQLKQIRDGIATREKNRDKICAERLTELTKDPALRWQDDPPPVPGPLPEGN